MKDSQRVYLINCPPGWTKTPSLALEYLKNYLKKENINVISSDLNEIVNSKLRLTNKNWLKIDHEFEQNLFKKIQTEAPQILKTLLEDIKKADFIGFSLFKRNAHFSFALAELIKSSYPEKTIIFGGPQTMFMKIHKVPFDKRFKWIIGEGELALTKIMKSKKTNILEYQEITNLDDLPFLRFDDFNLSSYGNFLPLLSSRGCVRKCKFCTENALYHKFRQHSPLYMVDQIELLIKKHSINNFSFQDSLINGNLKWLEDFCTLIIKRNLNIKWEAQIMIRNDFDETLARLLKKSGCFNLFVGLESGSDKVLEAMKKGFSQNEAILFFKTLNKAKLHFEISLIFGYADEGMKEFNETIDFIVKNKGIIPKIAQVNPFIDYFSKDYRLSDIGLKRTQLFTKIIDKEKIPHTKSFINNLFEN